MFTEYLDFKIQINSSGTNHYDVHVSSPGGEGQVNFKFNVNNKPYQKLAARLQQLDTDAIMLQNLGEYLFETLFQGGTRDVYVRSQGMLKTHQGLRLQFEIGAKATTIARLPWEFLADPDRGPIAMLDAPIMRYVPQSSVIRPLAISSFPLRVLITGAHTSRTLSIQHEIDEVQTALSTLGDNVLIGIEPHLTWQKLQRRLREGYHIWHFIGQGGLMPDGSTGALFFEENDSPIEAPRLNILLNRSGVRLVVLDACDSTKLITDPLYSVAPMLVRAEIPAVVAVQFPIPTDITRAFVGEFYRALVEGFPIDACVTEGRKAVVGIAGLGRADWGIPVVYTRARDGNLFSLPGIRSEETNIPLTPEPHFPISSADHFVSPYRFQTPLTEHQDLFVGRTEVIGRIQSLLESSHSLLLYGQQRIGKTSLLNNLGYQFRDAVITLRVSLRDAVVRSTDNAELLNTIASRIIVSAQQQRGLDLSMPSQESLSANPFFAFNEWLGIVKQALGENSVVLVMDDFDSLYHVDPSHFDIERLLGMLRDLLLRRPKWNILFVSSRYTPEELGDMPSYGSILRLLQPIKLDYLTEDESHLLITHPSSSLGLLYHSDAEHRVLALTRGHPFLLQLLCDKIVALKNSQESDRRWLVEYEDVEAVIPHVLLPFVSISRPPLARDQLALLRLIAVQGENVTLTWQQIAYSNIAMFTENLRKLEQRDLLEQVDGGYRFQVELIRRMFAEPVR